MLRFTPRSTAAALALSAVLSCHAHAQKAPPPGDACKLLTNVEVRQVFPGARDGVHETGAERYGVASCSWKLHEGHLGLNLIDDGDDLATEVRALVEAFVGPLRPDVARHVRLIKVAALGDAALGFAEPRNDAKGIPSPIALLMVQRGGKQITLFSNRTLTEAERDAAIRSLQDLARAAVRRI